MNIYIELLCASENLILFSDWTFYMDAWQRYNKKAYYEYLPQFLRVEGKETNYYIMGVDDENQARELAIYYHKATANGTISKYRLD